MKKLSIYLLSFIIFSSCINGQTPADQMGFASLPAPAKGEGVATFAGGCFWSLSEGLSELRGVNKVVAGYAGGTVKSPTYEDVCTKSTGHAESVQVYYDPAVISYATLAESFFYAHDPTTLNRQGPDEGTDYRSIAFYRNPEEKGILEEIIAKVNLSHHYNRPIVTQLLPFTILYPAEKYHQGYFRTHMDNPYIQSVSVPKVVKLREAMADKLRPEFQHKAS